MPTYQERCQMGTDSKREGELRKSMLSLRLNDDEGSMNVLSNDAKRVCNEKLPNIIVEVFSRKCDKKVHAGMNYKKIKKANSKQ